MKTNNPIFNDNVFAPSYGGQEVMTAQGTVNKCLILFLLMLAPAMWVWSQVMVAPVVDGMGIRVGAGNQGLAMTAAFIGAIAGLIAAVVTMFKKEWAPVTTPIYAVCEGFFIGGVSALFERSFPGIVMQAVALTFGTLFCLLMAYKFRIIRVTEKLRTGIIVATMAIGLVYLVSFVLGFFNVQVPFLRDSSPIGIGISLIIVGVAALNLLLDFDFIERGAESGVPKFMEWIGAFGLLVTLVWLYIEILNLLSKLRGRD